MRSTDLEKLRNMSGIKIKFDREKPFYSGCNYATSHEILMMLGCIQFTVVTILQYSALNADEGRDCSGNYSQSKVQGTACGSTVHEVRTEIGSAIIIGDSLDK